MAEPVAVVQVSLKKVNPQDDVPQEVIDWAIGDLSTWAGGLEAQIATRYPTLAVEVKVVDNP